MTDEQVEKIIKANMSLQMNIPGIRADFEEALRKPWVGLTDEDLIECERLAAIRHRKHMGSIRGQQLSPADQFLWHYARAIEAKLKEKNT